MNYLKTAVELGMEVGKEYIVVGDAGDDTFAKGDRVQFIEDDGSRCPRFLNLRTGKKAFAYAAAMQPADAKTPAQENGIVIGKQYRVKFSERANYIGRTFILDEDDGTNIPFFREVVGGEVQVTDGRYCFDVTGEGDKLEEIVEPGKEAVAYRVEVLHDGTQITINKRLSIDEVHALLKAAGV